MFSPWGPSQDTHSYAPGIVQVWTASHGGIHLTPELNAEVNPAWRNANGWYEEDCEWAIVALTFPQHFQQVEGMLAEADKSARNYFPDAYEKVTGKTLQAGDSYARDRAVFFAEHHEHWVVVSAIRADEPGQVNVTATLGGRGRERETWDQPRWFRVSKEEYDQRSEHGFVIDLERHPELQTNA
jgi:hypothetical protein